MRNMYALFFRKCGSYTMNVIASCCFGYKMNSQNPNDPFLQYAKEVFSQTFSIKILLARKLICKACLVVL